MSHKGPNHPFVVWAACILWLVSVVSICWSLVLFFCVGDMLFLNGTDLVNAVVLLSGIVMLPTKLYIIYAIAIGQKIEYKDKIFCCRLWMCIAWIIILNAIGVGLCMYRICSCRDTTMNYIFSSMKQYRTVPKHKHFIDNMQWALRCCGLKSYKDWFNQDWYDSIRDYEWNPSNKRNQKSIGLETDSVPLSCCKSGSCVSSYLKELGTYSINTDGCGYLMYQIVLISMNVHLVIFITVIILESMLLKFIVGKEKKIVRQNLTSRTFNVRHIMSVNDNFDASSGSYQMNADESDEIVTPRCDEDLDEN